MSKEKYFDVLNRISLYFDEIPYDGIFSDDDAPITINLLSKQYQIPVTVIRYDIATFLKSYKKANAKDCTYIIISPYDESFIFDKTSDEIYTDIISGVWDDLALVSTIPLKDEEHYVSLTQEEYIVLKSELSFEEGFEDYPAAIPFRIKKSYRYFDNPRQLYATLQIINNAINNGVQIVFSYKKSEGKNPTLIQTTPIKIIYDNEENLYHLLAIKNKNYEVYNIAMFCPSNAGKISSRGYVLYDDTISTACDDTVYLLKASAQPHDEEALQEKAPKVWKNAFSQKKATHVKIKFKEEAYYVVLRELALRNPKDKLSEIRDGYFFYEDDIYGIDAFDMWIRSLGSKAVIIQPKSLAIKRIESIKQALTNYK